MEKILIDNQSPSVWSSTQISKHGVDLIMRKVRKQLGTTRQELVDDLKAAGTTVTISNILHCRVLKSYGTQKIPLLKKAHVQTRLKFSNKHLDDSEEGWEEWLWSDETRIELFGINSTHRVWRGKI